MAGNETSSARPPRITQDGRSQAGGAEARPSVAPKDVVQRPGQTTPPCHTGVTDFA